MKRHDEKVNVQSWSRRFTDSPDRVRVQIVKYYDIKYNITRSCTSTSTSHHKARPAGQKKHALGFSVKTRLGVFCILTHE